MRDFLCSVHFAHKGQVAAICFLAAALSSRTVRGADKRACVVAHGEAQELWRGAKLLEAREKLLTCSQAICPAPVRDDCGPWLLDIERALPSVVVAARDDRGADATDVRFFIDDVLVGEALDGKAIGVDPGEHRFRFEHPPNPPVEERVALHEGEKARTIWVSFPAPAETSGSTGGSRGILPYILAGAAGVAFASFAYFGIKGKVDADACHGQCTAEEASPITRELMIADISLVSGLVLGGAAAWLFLSRPAPPVSAPARVSLEIVPRRRVSSKVRCEALQ